MSLFSKDTIFLFYPKPAILATDGGGAKKRDPRWSVAANDNNESKPPMLRRILFEGYVLH
jgi:hypothetical protein